MGKAKACFYILADGHPLKAIYPSIEIASTGERYTLQGPGMNAGGKNAFVIGAEDFEGERKDKAAPGMHFEIRFFVEEGAPYKVEWSQSKPGEALEDALIRGYFAYGL